MPIYEFRCTTCAHRFEQIVFGSDAPLKCPACDAAPDRVEQLFSAFAVGGTAAAPVAACGMCGDPRGPGACRN